jgi:hypothetical protein
MLGMEQLSPEDRNVVGRARRLERFLTQPFFTTMILSFDFLIVIRLISVKIIDLLCDNWYSHQKLCLQNNNLAFEERQRLLLDQLQRQNLACDLA